MVLCEVCQTTVTDWLIPRFFDLENYPNSKLSLYHWHLPSWGDLEFSSINCDLCLLIDSEAKDATGVADYPPNPAGKEGVRMQALGGGRLQVRCIERNLKAELHLAFDDESIERLPEDLARIFTARIVNETTADERNLKMIHRWLGKCTSSHSKCAKWSSSGSGRRLPTRLIKLVPSTDNARLVEPSDDDQTPYAALSYCWGKPANSYVTTKDNLLHRKTVLPVSHFPATLQDAVAVTRLLGVKYLWIDAVCIVQDDPQDWLREAPRMRDVYGNALFTIAATAATDASTGLLAHRTRRHSRKVALPFPNRDMNGKPLLMYAVPTFERHQASLDQSPLMRRSWAFQERMLSTRVLHFGRDLVRWECVEMCIGEDTMSESYTGTDGGFQIRKMLLGDSSHPEKSTNNDAATLVQFHDQWAWVLSQYTRRDLNFARDKLPALSGVAKAFDSPKKLGTYICGLWTNDFPRHLLWEVDRTFDTTFIHTRSHVYRAPTWSWACLNGAITNPAIKRHFTWSREGFRMHDELGLDELLSHALMQITHIDLKTEDATPFGPVLSASLEAEGHLLRIRRGRKLADVTYALEKLDGEIIGTGTWDVESETYGPAAHDLWACPVMQWKRVVEGRRMCACLLLAGAGGLTAGREVFARVGRGKCGVWWEGDGEGMAVPFLLV